MILCLPTPHPIPIYVHPLHPFTTTTITTTSPASQPFIDSSFGSSRSIVGRSVGRSSWLAGWQHHAAKSAKSDCGAPLLLLLCVISHKQQKKSNHTKMLGCEMDPSHASLTPSLPHSLPHSSCGDVSSMISAAKKQKSGLL